MISDHHVDAEPLDLFCRQVGVAAGRHDAGVRMIAPYLTQDLARLARRHVSNGAGVEDEQVGVVTRAYDAVAMPGQDQGELLHLADIEPTADRIKANAHV